MYCICVLAREKCYLKIEMPTATFQLQVWGEEVPNRRKAALLFKKIYIYSQAFWIIQGKAHSLPPPRIVWKGRL